MIVIFTCNYFMLKNESNENLFVAVLYSGYFLLNVTGAVGKR